MSTALQWFKSSYSGSQGGDCVEVATQPSAVHVRDSKNTGPTLRVALGTWDTFLGLARRNGIE
ncbi:DUF397 domain-containing protein [Streptomyces sp. S3(2020)]|uniref:DUF397 domain-containing protein n=1 Tax=Streptomyces sp. S3(2020) TaxID=2732044 RepID=UPI001488D9B5|nr:DUF397 domain-containing protein [Streptomyces sp. S3(2020)]NNN31738.1 DUF397 domain-containing protein [Streptomyces sp. S3(2020)]